MSAREQFAAAVRASPVDLGRACLLVGREVDPGLSVAAGLRQLDALSAGARRHVPAGGTPAEQARGLERALGVEAGFAGSGPDYQDVRASLLHEVLRRRRGLPLTLSVVWVEVARRLGVEAAPVALPTRVVVAVGRPDPAYCDPFSGGGLVTPGGLQDLVRAAGGPALFAADLRPADPVDLVLRLLTNVRALADRQGRLLGSAQMQLWAVELSLLLPRHPFALRRERGELLVRLGEFARGAADLEQVAAVLEDSDPAGAETLRRRAGLARARLN